jgi:enamine deaminase RidA (YjgF/YER057c/UK114 family)
LPNHLRRSIVEPRNPILNVSRSRSLPHSPAVRAGDLLFISGMSSLDPVTGERNLGQSVNRCARFSPMLPICSTASALAWSGS